jgi:hypothetical protein
MKRKIERISTKEYNCDADDEYEHSEEEVEQLSIKIRKISINEKKSICKLKTIKFNKIDVKKVPSYIN